VIQTDRAHKENLTDIMKDAGIDNYRIVFAPLATAEAVIDEDDKESGAIIVSLGDQTTELAVYINGIVKMAKVIPFGSHNITSDLKIVLKTDYKSANEIKKNTATAFPEDADSEKMIQVPNSSSQKLEFSEQYIAKIVEARLKEIYDFVTKEIYKGNYQRMVHSPVIITGPGSRLKGSEKLFSEMNHSKTVPGTALGIKCKAEELEDEYFTAAGLVKYAVNNDIFTDREESTGNKGIIKKVKQFVMDLF
jgi:cell division protein FtsA